jgi:hypothetical protein
MQGMKVNEIIERKNLKAIEKYVCVCVCVCWK